jgi:hypothetical protein
LRVGLEGHQANSVYVAKMLTVIAIMLIAVGVRIPLVNIVNMRVMRLMKDLVIYEISDALYTGE